jgi:hypothetical protein
VALFNLLTNPFYLLAVDPAATNQQVDDAVRNCALGSEQARAQIAILDPSQRLSLELSYPIDSQPKQIEALYKALSRHAPADEVLQPSTELGPLSRANLIAHLAADRPASAAILSALVDAHASIEIPAVFAILRSLRAAAGLVSPSLVNVNDGVQALLALHTQAAIASYASPENAAEEMSACVGQILADTGQYHLEALARLVAAYRAHTSLRLETNANRIQTACTALSHEPGDVEARDELAAALQDWAAIIRPLMLFDGDQEPGDERVAACVDLLRDLIGDLVDDHHYDEALSVARSAREAFAPIRETAEELDQAIPLIGQWSLDAVLNQLQLCIEDIASDPASLDSILETGFGSESIDHAKQLWENFLQSTRLTTSDEDEPWLMVRDLAAHLAEHAQRGFVATALLIGLITHTEQGSASPAVLGALTEELQRIKPPPPEEVEQIPPSRFAREEASKHRLFRPAKATIFAMAMVGVVGTAAALYYEGDRLRSFMPRPAATPGQALTEAETPPAVGTGQHLELSGVRYCLYQEERLKIMKPDVKSPEDARAYNLLVVDYNSRCSDFFFKDADLAVVKAEIAANQERLAADAKAIISTWPGHPPVAGNQQTNEILAPDLRSK